MVYLLVACGLVGGFLSGLLGLGGGVVFVPALVFLVGVPIQQAVGISLAVVVPTALSGLGRHMLLGNINFKVALPLVVFAMIGAWGGAAFSNAVPAATLRKIFGVCLLLISLNTIFEWTNPATHLSKIDSMQKTQELTNDE